MASFQWNGGIKGVSGQQIPWAWRPKLVRHEIPLFVTIQTFLRLLGFLYFIAFTSLGVQALGLIGSRGILPFADYLAAAREALGAGRTGACRRFCGCIRPTPPSPPVWIAGALLSLARSSAYGSVRSWPAAWYSGFRSAPWARISFRSSGTSCFPKWAFWRSSPTGSRMQRLAVPLAAVPPDVLQRRGEAAPATTPPGAI